MHPPAAEQIEQARLRLRALRDAMEQLRSPTRHTASARFLLNLCQTAWDGLSSQLDRIDPAARPDRVQTAVDGILLPAQLIHVFLAFVQAATVERMPQAMSAPLQHLAAPLVPRSRMLVYYDWRPSNYSFRRDVPVQLSWMLSEALEHPDGQEPAAVKAVPPLFAVLSLPAADQHNVLLHSLLGHEIGHALVEFEGRPHPQAALPAGVDQATATQVLSDWHNELLADAWAVFLLGPAPLLALMELAARRPARHTASDSHPCDYLRFSLMRQCLRTVGFISPDSPPADLEWLDEEVNTAVARAKGFQPTAGDQPVFVWAHEVLNNELAQIATSVLTTQDAYQRATWQAECVELDPNDALSRPRHSLVWRLLHYAPPDCFDSADARPSLASILNAGWAVRKDPPTWRAFSEAFSLPESDREYESVKRLNGLLLKAIETTSIVRDWEEIL